MSTIKLNGTSSGSSIIKAPDSGSTNQTFTLPASSGTLVTTTDAGVAGITSSADATAMTITSDEKVGIGVADPDSTLEVSNNTSTYTTHIASTKNATGDNALAITTYDENASNTSYLIRCTTNTNVAGAGNDRFAVMSDGRGLSQFTAKAWILFNGRGTVAITDSHNVSSVTDNGTGSYLVNLSNACANSNYAVVCVCDAWSWDSYASTTPASKNSSRFQIMTSRSSATGREDNDHISALAFGD